MYTTCLQCHARLGDNELLPTFPVGRRLAYDVAGGRLWVVCRRCEVWNLAPFEERFEAMEDAERLFRATRTRVATGEIGLARLRDGRGAVDLVRIGKPLRPEFASWRYGERFVARNRRHSIAAAAGALGILGTFLSSTAIVTSGVGAGLLVAGTLVEWRLTRRTRETRLAIPGHPTPVLLKADHLQRVRLLPRDDAFALRIPHRLQDGAPLVDTTTLLEGDDAVRAARVVLPAINALGGNRKSVADAVALLEAELAAGRASLVSRLATHGRLTFPRDSGIASDPAVERWLGNVPLEKRLALEIALNEDVERRAMEGELSLLEIAWRDAERIASIVDSMS